MKHPSAGTFDEKGEETPHRLQHGLEESLDESKRIHWRYSTGVVFFHRRILRIRSLTKSGPTVPIMHAILAMKGIDAGHSRSPLIDISDGLKKKVEADLKKMGLL